jgi:hypothetical protein
MTTSAYVDGELYDQNGTLLDAEWDEEDFIAQVNTSASANPGTVYTEVGYHDVIARYYYEDIERGPEGCMPCDGCNTDCYYFYDNWWWEDPFGFRFANTGYYGPWWDIYGFGPPAEIENDETISLGQTSQSLQTPAAKVDIRLNGSSVTGQTVTVIVGQEINLTTAPQPSNGTVTNSQWTVPGGNSDRIANWVASFIDPTQATSAAVANLTTLNNSSVDFYWISGGNGRTVQYTAKINGNSVSAQVTFNVQRPTATLSAATNTSTNIGFDPDVQLKVLQLGDAGATPGLVFTRTITTMPSGFNGTMQWVQVSVIRMEHSLLPTVN